MKANLEKEIIAFLNDYLKEAKEKFSFLTGKGIAGKKSGYYFNSSDNGLLPGTYIGLNANNKKLHAFLRFWEEERIEKNYENIEKKLNILEEHSSEFKILLGESVSYHHYKKQVSSFNSIGDDRIRGFSVTFPTYTKLSKEIKNDLDTALSAIKLMKEYMEEPLTDDSLGNRNDGEDKMNENKEIALNTILYGPPGTGKTFNTMAYAVAICDKKDVEEIKKEMRENYDSVKQRYDSLKDEGRIEFVTFHQSYGYEDFIEGIKPDLDDSTGMLKYKLETGRFKAFCDKISGNFEEAWGVLCDKLDDEDKEYLEIPYISDKSKTFAIEWNVSHNGLKAKDAHRFFNKKQLQNIYRKKPGVKKGGHDNYRKAIVEYMKKECGLKEFNGNESNDLPSNARVFIIDEINRGNISKIFGELITLIEPSKRLGEREWVKVTLPCSGDEFGVPNNVYILGTMNTADRSIAMMDTALRRRFNFVEMMPDTSESSPLKGKVIDGIDVCSMLKTINERIEYLYDREHTIGHAFFVKVETFDDLKLVFRNKVIPLLQEYFYDDYEKIRLVLGDNEKDEKNQFIKRAHLQEGLFKKGKDDEDLNSEKNIYRINQEALGNPDSYKGII